jgi:ATP-dependent DNA helicase RecG
MAPTEILANQHYQTICEFLKDMDADVKLLTGSTKKSERKLIDADLTSGKTDILVGTHALIEETVQFKNIGFVVIDEQHRFGVEQRAKLHYKNLIPPHILVMTATPIPRTLAMTLYGDLDISVIDELPPGRKEIKTVHFYENKRLRLFGFMREQIKAGRQIYVVYPLIKESEKMDYKNLEDGYAAINEAFPPPDYVTCVVHGKMKADDKDFSMNYFASGKAHILVATSVIEVGVNVPNASVMVIESAERFGLSQLHQLRGRVGRGAEQSYCFLMSDVKLTIEARKRLQLMVRTNNGFEIAEEDMKLRGPGDIEGTQQSGLPFNLRISDLAKDGRLLEYVRNIAFDILNEDNSLEMEKNSLLRTILEKEYKKSIDYSAIS